MYIVSKKTFSKFSNSWKVRMTYCLRSWTLKCRRLGNLIWNKIYIQYSIISLVVICLKTNRNGGHRGLKINPNICRKHSFTVDTGGFDSQVCYWNQFEFDFGQWKYKRGKFDSNITNYSKKWNSFFKINFNLLKRLWKRMQRWDCGFYL